MADEERDGSISETKPASDAPALRRRDDFSTEIMVKVRPGKEADIDLCQNRRD